MSDRPAVLITGASRGIGAATARQLVSLGHRVGLLARSEAPLADLASELGPSAVALPADLTDVAQVAAAVRHMTRTIGPPGVLVSNAGRIDPIGRFEDLPPDALLTGLGPTLLGAWNAAHAVVDVFKAAGGGTIVHVSSGAAHRPLEGWAPYCVAKAGLLMLTRCLHHELHQEGIFVVGFQPGTVDTQMQARIRASGLNPVSQMHRSAHLPAHVPAACIAWLCRNQDPALAGRDLRVDDLRHRVGV